MLSERRERDEYKHTYVVLLEAYRRLEAGLAGQRARHDLFRSTLEPMFQR